MFWVIHYYCKLCNGWKDQDFYGTRAEAIWFAMKVQLSRLTAVWVEGEDGTRIWG